MFLQASTKRSLSKKIKREQNPAGYGKSTILRQISELESLYLSHDIRMPPHIEVTLN
jgi:ABC-type polar amino acid transport system ATPase subunit